MRIAPDGEVEVQGPVVFQGYWHDPQATSEVFDGRWWRTGDLGRLDDDGYLDITSRNKDLIITAGGKNVVPAVLEDRLREHWLIEECVGDRRPYTAVSRPEGINRFCVLPAGFAVGTEPTRHKRLAPTTCWPSSPPTSRPSTPDQAPASDLHQRELKADPADLGLTPRTRWPSDL